MIVFTNLPIISNLIRHTMTSLAIPASELSILNVSCNTAIYAHLLQDVGIGLQLCHDLLADRMEMCQLVGVYRVAHQVNESILVQQHLK